MLKAGGHWNAKLTVPEEIREVAGGPQSRQSLDGDPRSFTWIIEVTSQVIFSTTAAVHFEVLVGRDERSVDLGFHAGAGTGQGAPGKLEDHQQGRSRNAAQPKGVYSKAVRLAVDDTESLWNTPAFPRWENDGTATTDQGPHHGDKADAGAKEEHKQRKQTRVHLVVLTHGLHSNLGADMLYMKESIDTAAKQAREDRKSMRDRSRNEKVQQDARSNMKGDVTKSASTPEVAIAPTEHSTEEESDDDEEQVIVRGFSGNAVRTEKGIQYLGKRLAKYVLSITYPDQPYLPVKGSLSKSIARTFSTSNMTNADGQPIHKRSSIIKDEEHVNDNLAYKITSISFISHSLGGNIQTYAIAYIQKHSPDFFDRIEPINFVAMASPFLGLSNENPMYVKFALDFGLVGRTGQDLGLTWKPPTAVRNGWETMIGGLSGEASKARRQPNPAAKPLLRVLPTGPAHVALKKFRNRSVYSNVVNDGIVPLRTSCLLFLDWRGLGRVEKARRDNGLVGTMVGWGWSEMMGQNASTPRKPRAGWNDLFSDSASGDDSSEGRAARGSRDSREDVPQPDEGGEVDGETTKNPQKSRSLDDRPFQDEVYDRKVSETPSKQQSGGLFSGFMALFKGSQASPKAHHHAPKQQKIYYRSQIRNESPRSRPESKDAINGNQNQSRPGSNAAQKGLVRGSSLYTNNSQNEELEAPPRTTFFESAGDLLNPPLPPKEFLIDPEARPRTIFHDRVYHPEDIPPPPTKRQRTLMSRAGSREDLKKTDSSSTLVASNEPVNVPDTGSMKIEEKIARAYHKDLSWRKVLVRLEPDAHNNMVVRRMFANAYGWPVIKHLCDTHFAYTAATQMPDSEEQNTERAKASDVPAGKEGQEVEGQTDLPNESAQHANDEARARSLSLRRHDEDADQLPEEMHKAGLKIKPPRRTDSEIREATDEVNEIVSPTTAAAATASSSYSSALRATNSRLARQDSAQWSDRFFEGSEDDDSEDEEYLASTAKDKRKTEELSGEPGTTDTSDQPRVADVLTQSPNESTESLPTTAEPQPLRKNRSEPTDGIPDPAILGLTGVGMSPTKKVERGVATARADERSAAGPKSNLGVATQVAFARTRKGREDAGW